MFFCRAFLARSGLVWEWVWEREDVWVGVDMGIDVGVDVGVGVGGLRWCRCLW
jgi:hypothetical protein